MLRVRDIMTKKVYTVDFDTSAEEAAWGLTRRQIGAAPVRNREGALVGMLTKSVSEKSDGQSWNGDGVVRRALESKSSLSLRERAG